MANNNFRAYMDLIHGIETNGGVQCQEAPDTFFYDHGDKNKVYKIKTAKKICYDCPVKFLCLEYALESNEQEGIWGGLTSNERRALGRRGLAS